MTQATTYRMLTLDVDGTTLDSHKRVTPGVRAAVSGLVSRGIPVSWCTGRNAAELSDPRAELPEIRYGVLMSGALVYDFERKTSLREVPLPADLLLEAIALAEEVGAAAHLMTADGSYMDQDILDHGARYHMALYHPLHARTAVGVDSPSDFVRAHPTATLKANLYHRDAKTREATRARLEASGLTLAFSEASSLECTSPGVSKATGTAALASSLGITPSEVVAVGDAPNDLPALRAAGLAVAMGNASEEVKRTCDLVVADNDHDGVAEAIARAFPEA